MENAGDTASATAAMHAAMSTPATTSQDPHAVPSAEGSQAQETVPYGVADPERWPEPADPANPGGGIKP